MFGQILSKATVPRHLRGIKIRGKKPINVNNHRYTWITAELKFSRSFSDDKSIKILIFCENAMTPKEIFFSDEEILKLQMENEKDNKETLAWYELLRI